MSKTKETACERLHRLISEHYQDETERETLYTALANFVDEIKEAPQEWETAPRSGERSQMENMNVAH